MFFTFGQCQGLDPVQLHRRSQQRRLELLRCWRDGLERRLAAVDAAISTLQQQLERDREIPPQP